MNNIILLLMMFQVTSCSQGEKSNISIGTSQVLKEYELHFQDGFNETKIKILLNDSIIFSGDISTDQVEGLAIIRHIKTSEESIQIRVNGKPQEVIVFDPKIKYYQLNLDSNNDIVLTHSSEVILYD